MELLAGFSLVVVWTEKLEVIGAIDKCKSPRYCHINGITWCKGVALGWCFVS